MGELKEGQYILVRGKGGALEPPKPPEPTEAPLEAEAFWSPDEPAEAATEPALDAVYDPANGNVVEFLESPPMPTLELGDRPRIRPESLAPDALDKYLGQGGRLQKILKDLDPKGPAMRDLRVRLAVAADRAVLHADTMTEAAAILERQIDGIVREVLGDSKHQKEVFG